jgi:hypothetical protein
MLKNFSLIAAAATAVPMFSRNYVRLFDLFYFFLNCLFVCISLKKLHEKKWQSTEHTHTAPITKQI